MYPTIEFWEYSIGTYSVLSVLGFLTCGAVAFFTRKYHKMQFEDVAMVILAIIVGLFLGSHLLYGLVNFRGVLAVFAHFSELSFKEIILLLGKGFGGMVFYGGFLGGLFALWVFKKLTKFEFNRHLYDVYAFSIPLFHTFGRIGCFFGGCCYGIESDFGFIVYGNELIPQLNGVRRFPVSLLEAACNLIIFTVIFILFRKRKLQGKLIYVYTFIYPIVRFSDEFLRGDRARGIYFGLSTSQWISIVLFAFTVYKIIQFKLNKNNTNLPTTNNASA